MALNENPAHILARPGRLFRTVNPPIMHCPKCQPLVVIYGRWLLMRPLHVSLPHYHQVTTETHAMLLSIFYLVYEGNFEKKNLILHIE